MQLMIQRQCRVLPEASNPQPPRNPVSGLLFRLLDLSLQQECGRHFVELLTSIYPSRWKIYGCRQRASLSWINLHFNEHLNESKKIGEVTFWRAFIPALSSQLSLAMHCLRRRLLLRCSRRIASSILECFLYFGSPLSVKAQRY